MAANERPREGHYFQRTKMHGSEREYRLPVDYRQPGTAQHRFQQHDWSYLRSEWGMNK